MKTLLINQGIPGSGKSSGTSAHVETLPLGAYVVCSADTYHLDIEGIYNFRPENIGLAHAQCLLNALEALRHGINLVIVDNTNITQVEMAPYAALAQAFKYDVLVKRYNCSPETGITRNTHDVPDAVIRAMYVDLEEPLDRWGKFEIVETD